jgi:hypothetical protein
MKVSVDSLVSEMASELGLENPLHKKSLDLQLKKKKKKKKVFLVLRKKSIVKSRKRKKK